MSYQDYRPKVSKSALSAKIDFSQAEGPVL